MTKKIKPVRAWGIDGDYLVASRKVRDVVGTTVPYFNDHNTHADVLRVLDGLIAEG